MYNRKRHEEEWCTSRPEAKMIDKIKKNVKDYALSLDEDTKKNTLTCDMNYENFTYKIKKDIKIKCKLSMGSTESDKIIISNITNNNTNNTDNTNNSTDNSTNITDNSVKTVNITLNAFGNEDYSHLTIDEFSNIYDRCFTGLVILADKVFFNKDKPENHNTLVKCLKDNFVYVYNGEKWVIRTKDDVSEAIYCKNKQFLDDKILEGKFPLVMTQRFDTVRRNGDDDDVIKAVKKQIIRACYNGRDLVQKSIGKKGIR